MKQLLLTLAIFPMLLTQAQDKNQITDKRFAGVDTALARVLSVWKGPGFAVVVVEKNKVVYANGFGFRNYEEKLPVTPNTLFAIGSCTKAFTASLIGELAAKGDLDIDKPVRNYLPDLKFFNDDMNDRITLRDMMCHRTGLPRHDFAWYLFSTTTRDSLVKRLQYLEPSARVRDKWQYNNFMFMLQGVVVEKITHQTWETNIKNNIFLPLGMNHSNTSIADMEKDPDAALGYEIKDSANIRRIHKLEYFHIDAMGPAGSINSSVMDMSNWLITWIHGGKFNNKEIIPAGFAKEAMSSQMIAGSGFPEADTKDLQFSNYGFGWSLASYRGHYRVEHGGNIDGFSASTSFFPSDSIGIVVLTNQNASSIPSIVRNILADKILGLKYYDWNSYMWNNYAKMKQEEKEAESSKVKSDKARTIPSHPLKNYTGLFNNKGYGSMDIFIDHDSLFLQTGKSISWLKQDQYDWFKMYERDKQGHVDTSQGFSIEFRTDQTGEINEINAAFEPSVKTIVFSRIPKTAVIQTDSLKKFEGVYLIGQLELKVFLQNNSLHLSVPGQPDYELIPIEENKFTLKDMSGFTITFNRNEKNEVTAMTSNQPNGTFKAIRKP
ncbi:MAG TPA: serine hydrolase [Puia sp.]|nr:serine hydrolase [Puia sp.]